MVKWTTHDLCLVASESDFKSCTNFEFCEEKIINTKKVYWSTLSNDKNNSKKSLHIVEDGASGVQVGDIEMATV